MRLGGRITAVDGLNITLDQEPDFADWTGAKLSWMIANAEGEPELQEASVTAHTDNVVTIDSDGGNPPVPTFPWLIEFPNRTAQLFRVLGVGQEAEGVYEISALRYREDIFAAVDFDTPLQEDESYLYKPVNPTAPPTSKLTWSGTTTLRQSICGGTRQSKALS